MESALGFMHAYLQAGLVGLPLPIRMGSETMGMYPMGAFQTQNGEYCLVQVSNEIQWATILRHTWCSRAGQRCELCDQSTTGQEPRCVAAADSRLPALADCPRVGSVVHSGRRSCKPCAPSQRRSCRRTGACAEHGEAGSSCKRSRDSNLGVPIKVNEKLESRMLSVPSLDQHRAEILLELDQSAE